MVKRNYAALLFNSGVSILAIALYLSKQNEYAQLRELVRTATGVDLASAELVKFSPEDIEALSKFENDYKQFLLGIILGSDLEDPFHIQRERELDLQEQNSNRISTNFNFTYWYGACITLFVMMYIFMVTWIPIPPGHERFADTCLGALIGSWMQTVINRFFTSQPNNNLFSKLSPFNKKKKEDECEDEDDFTPPPPQKDK